MGIALITNNILSDSGTAVAGLVPTSRTISTTSPLTGGGDLSADRTIAIPAATSAVNGYLTSADWTTFNGKQAAGNYITSLTGEATGTGPGATAVTLNNASVTGKVLTGVNITGGTVLATDTMLTAFGKLQNQINGLIGSTIYQGVWNASTNTPTLTSSTGTRGYYYIVNVAGNTNLNGITDWQVGDWAIYDGTAWQKVDNTDAVSSVNGFTGAVSLTTDNIAQGTTNLYFANSLARAAVSLTTTGSSGAATYNNTTGVFNIPNYGTALANYLPLTGGTLTGALVINPANTGVIGLDVASNTVRLRSDSTNPFARQLTTTMNSGTLVKMQAAGYGGTYVTDLGFYTSSSSAINTTPNLYLTGGNNRVGINTDVPAYVLDVVGTAGVSGQLTLGATITNGTYTYTLPSATGTLALTSQIPSVTGYVPYTGATGAVNLGAYDLTVNSIKVGLGGSNIASNTALGASTLNSNTTGSGNTAAGNSALYTNTTGGSNSAFGTYSLLFNTTGGLNTAIGGAALYSNTTGSSNTATGINSLYSNTTGGANSAFGVQALYTNTTGIYNTAIGSNALYANTTANYNTALGNNALLANTTGASNTAVGNGAGQTITTGSNNTLVGGYGGTTTMSGNVVLSDGAGNIRFQYNGSNTILGQSGNVGIGVTPSTWNTAYIVLQVGSTGTLFNTASNTILGQNIYVNSGDNNTYLTSNYATQYRQVNGQHIWYTAASGTAGTTISFSQPMTLFSNGNLGVGVGGTDSGYKLDVNGTGRFTGNLGVGTAPYSWATLKGIDLGSNAALGSYDGYYTMLTNNTYYNGSDFKYKVNGYAGWLQLRSDDGTINLATTNSSGTAGASVTGMTSRLSFAASGAATFSSSIKSVGRIFTTSDAAYGDLVSTTGCLVFSFDATGQEAYLRSYNYTTALGKPMNFNASKYVFNEGSVGIGTTSPAKTLTVVNTAEQLRLSYDGSTTYADFRNDSAGGLLINTSASYIINYIGGSEKFRIASNGDLYAANNAALFYGASALTYVAGGNTSLTLAVNGSPRLEIDSGGSVTIGNSSTSNTGKFQYASPGVGSFNGVLQLFHSTSNVSGSGFVNFYVNTSVIGSIGQVGTTAVIYNTTSDYRLKEDLKEIKGLEIVNKIKVYDYKWKNDNFRMDGVLAHELAEVLPYAVTGIKDGEQMQQVDYSKIVPVMVQAIKELKAELDTLKK